MSNFETSTVEINLRFNPHIKFFELLQNSLFESSPDYYNPNSTGTIIDYYLEFSTQPANIGSITSFVTDSTSLDLISFVSPETSASLFLDSRLSESLKLNNNEAILNTTNAELIYSETAIQPLSLTPRDANVYTSATNLITRYDSATDLIDLVFINDGSNTTMLAPTLMTELERIVKPDFYDDTSTNPQLSGWAVALSGILPSLYQNDTLDNIIDRSNEATVFQATRPEYVHYLENLPTIAYDTQTDNILTFGNETTASGYLVLDFGVIPSVKAKDLKNNNVSSLILFTVTEDLQPENLIAVANTKNVQYGTSQGNIEEDYLSIKLKFVLCCSDLVII